MAYRITLLRKECAKCHIDKPLDQFHKRRASIDGLQPKCIECRRQGKSENERLRANERTKEWARNNPEAVKNNNLKKYGITLADFDAMLEKQAGVCAVCLRPAVGGRNSAARLNVDHDHNTGRVRGLLCTNCNTAIGLMLDSPDRLLAAARYLETH